MARRRNAIDVGAGAVWALQWIAVESTEAAARQALAAMTLQDGFLGGRVVPPGSGKPGWKAQAFFEDVPMTQMPEGMRRVIVPANLRGVLGFKDNPRGRRNPPRRKGTPEQAYKTGYHNGFIGAGMGPHQLTNKDYVRGWKDGRAAREAQDSGGRRNPRGLSVRLVWTTANGSEHSRSFRTLGEAHAALALIARPGGPGVLDWTINQVRGGAVRVLDSIEIQRTRPQYAGNPRPRQKAPLAQVGRTFAKGLRFGAAVHIGATTKTGQKLPGTWIVVKRQGQRLVVMHPKTRALASVPRNAVTLANPQPSAAEVERAARAYQAFHWGTEPRKQVRVKVPRPSGRLWAIGKLHSAAYTTTKGKEGRHTWEHEFGEGGGKKPTLATDGKRLFVIGGTYKIKPEGITG